MIKKISSQNGLSLIEILVAVALFLMSLAGSLSIIISAMDSSNRAESAYIAYNLAKSRLEDLKAFSFTDLAVAAETDTYLGKDGVPDIEGSFKRSTNVTASYAADTNLMQVTVNVHYKYRGQWSPNAIQLSTAIYNGS